MTEEGSRGCNSTRYQRARGFIAGLESTESGRVLDERGYTRLVDDLNC
jgi:hypothetical protein